MGLRIGIRKQRVAMLWEITIIVFAVAAIALAQSTTGPASQPAGDHPQVDELHQKLKTALGRYPKGDPLIEFFQLIVHEPEGPSQVVFSYRDSGDEEPQLAMSFSIGEPQPAQRTAAQRLGFTELAAKEITLRFGPNKGKAVKIFGYSMPVKDTKASVRLCLRVFHEVRGAEPNAWVWITEIPEPDEWPEPLPKPDVWPPK